MNETVYLYRETLSDMPNKDVDSGLNKVGCISEQYIRSLCLRSTMHILQAGKQIISSSEWCGMDWPGLRMDRVMLSKSD